MKRALAILALSAVALGAVGCGGDDDSAADATATQDADIGTEDRNEASSSRELPACSLLTDDEIEAQLTASVTQDLDGGYQITSTETSEPEHSVCAYQWASETQVGGSPAEEGQFTVELRPAEVVELTRGDLDEDPIPGVGDEAFFRAEVPYAIVGDLAVSITNFQRGKDAQTALLRAAANRL